MMAAPQSTPTETAIISIVTSKNIIADKDHVRPHNRLGLMQADNVCYHKKEITNVFVHEFPPRQNALCHHKTTPSSVACYQKAAVIDDSLQLFKVTTTCIATTIDS